MASAVMVCTGELVAGQCPEGAASWVSWGEALPWADLGVTPENIAGVYAWGVGAVLTLWALGYAVGAGVRLVRRA